MPVVEIRNDKGYRLGAIRFEIDENNEIEINETSNNIRFNGYSFDKNFDTNEDQINIEIKNSKTFSSGNYENVGHIPDECQSLVKEYNSYDVLLKYFKQKKYYDCYIIIANYMGHIDYCKEFSYNKSHDDIVKILFESLLSSLDPNHKNDRFEKFILSMQKHIIWNLETIHNYDLKTNSFMRE